MFKPTFIREGRFFRAVIVDLHSMTLFAVGIEKRVSVVAAYLDADELQRLVLGLPL